MKTHDQTTLNTQTTQGHIPPKRGNSSLLTSIGAVLVVAVLIAVSITVFTVWRAGRGTGNTPPQGQWKTALNGYVVASLVAARSNPSVVYVCAAYTDSSNVVSSDITYSISRSTDFGNSWQTSQASGPDTAMRGSCQLAVNPNNSNDIYAVGGISTAQRGVVMVLKHSTDGGQTWTIIQPVLHYPVPGPAQTKIGWQVSQITVVRNTLFGIQAVAGPVGPPRVPGVKAGAPLPAIAYAMPHLTMSVDGGHNWTVIDKDISVTLHSVRSYAVDPTNAQTIYALLDTPWWPYGATPGAPNDLEPNNYGMNGTLYKTTNGGETWKAILQNLRYGTEVQIASGNPNILYVGSLNVPMPLTAQPATGVDQGQSTTPAHPAWGTAVYGAYHLQVSKNAGASWQEVATIPNQFVLQSWFVSANGQLYTASNIVYNGGPQPTAIVGTVIPSGTSAVNGMQRTLPVRTSADTANASAPTPGKVMRYDPTTNSWQTVTQFTAPGSLLTVTATTSSSGAALWLAGTVNGKAMLSRYVVAMV